MRLTRHEITLLLAVVVALTTGVAVKRYRDRHPPANPVPAGIRGR